MYITFLDVDVGTRKKVLSKIGVKFIREFGNVPENCEEFSKEFDQLNIDSDIIKILKESYDRTGYTVQYTPDMICQAYNALMR